MANKDVKAETPKEKKVIINIPIERNGDESDVFVSVNDRTWQIKRGEDVEVPLCVEEAIKNSNRQYAKAVQYDKAHEKK